MFTHFSHVLMADDTTRWLSERSTNGVVLGKMDGWIESHEQEVDHWDGLEISFSKILEFTRNESSMDYNFVGKNCKHFCYDFRRNVLGKVEDFGTYCQFIETSIMSLAQYAPKTFKFTSFPSVPLMTKYPLKKLVSSYSA
ncbi:hypothetical protein BDEG_26290 [Batrachochytrium dendrobatidis JEL423]|uniref:Uncharacterized protein n=1 Tax=Batrachochytrium dendrobatidis (strain JEL423) TaxID=403673 RepID=A0A177WRZ7_BATDL|nr:hypothetical protein BDEG_26290 [Batrachochytrium dendrobatidis JEL423]